MYERAARRLIFLSPGSDDLGHVVGPCGRWLFTARRRWFVAEYVGDAERLDAGRGLCFLSNGRRTGNGPATLLGGRRHRHHIDATGRRAAVELQRWRRR